MDAAASIVKAVLSETGQKLPGDSDVGASDQPRTGHGNADRTWDPASAILRESPEVCRSFGRRLGSVIVILALLVSRRARGRLVLGVWIGCVGVLKYLGYL